MGDRKRIVPLLIFPANNYPEDHYNIKVDFWRKGYIKNVHFSITINHLLKIDMTMPDLFRIRNVAIGAAYQAGAVLRHYLGNIQHLKKKKQISIWSRKPMLRPRLSSSKPFTRHFPTMPLSRKKAAHADRHAIAAGLLIRWMAPPILPINSGCFRCPSDLRKMAKWPWAWF